MAPVHAELPVAHIRNLGWNEISVKWLDFRGVLPETRVRDKTHFAMGPAGLPGFDSRGRGETRRGRGQTMLEKIQDKAEAKHGNIREETGGANGRKSQTLLETEPAARSCSSVPENQTRARCRAKSITAAQALTSMVEPFIEAGAAAEFLNYSPRTIEQMAREGRIPAHPFGSGARKRWYFLISELAEHLRGQVNSVHGEAGRDKTQRRVI